MKFLLAVVAASMGSAGFAGTDQYGGDDRVKSDATGYFRVEQIGGRWFFVTPEGHGYVALGANHVGKYLDQQADEMGLFARVEGGREEAAMYLADAMVNIGLNAGEAYAPIAPELKSKLPWVHNVRFPFESKFAFDVFADEFTEKLTASVVKQCEEIKSDPMVLGIAFNDLPIWDERRVRYYEQLPDDAAGAIELAKFRTADKTDNEFLGHVAETLYRSMLNATRLAAPNHLFFGERFYLRSAPDEVLRAVGKHVDVFCTQALILSPQRPPEWQVFQREGYDHEFEIVQKPIVIIDWAAPFSLGKMFDTERGVIKNEQDAALEAAEWLKSAVATPFIIGVFKCQFIGTHANDRWFDGRARRTYLKDDGAPFGVRTSITEKAHNDALNSAYQVGE